MPNDPPADIAHVDEALQAWRQGDCVLGEQWFAHRFAPAEPLTDEAKAAAAAGVDLAESETRGLMIVSQSCDVVRSCSERPFVEVCPLVELEEDVFQQVERGRRPQFAFIPGVADRRLAGDLDRIMTVERRSLPGGTGPRAATATPRGAGSPPLWPASACDSLSRTTSSPSPGGCRTGSRRSTTRRVPRGMARAGDAWRPVPQRRRGHHLSR